MKLYKTKYLFLSLFAMILLASCNKETTTDPMAVATCDDGIMNGTETGVDCGGACEPCEALDFSGVYVQVDHMGRPGINTTLSAEGTIKDANNVTIPSEMVAAFQADFQARLEQYHDVYANKLGLNPDDVNYENNILGLDAATLTTVLAADVLDVAPNLPTTYFDPGEDNDGDDNPLTLDGDEVALTGRTLQDDVIDVSLILFFGGMEGNRFSGQDTDMDGEANFPRLTSDGVSFTANPIDNFPYLGAPE